MNGLLLEIKGSLEDLLMGLSGAVKIKKKENILKKILN
jgi:hypothetical protein